MNNGQSQRQDGRFQRRGARRCDFFRVQRVQIGSDYIWPSSLYMHLAKGHLSPELLTKRILFLCVCSSRFRKSCEFGY
ncbi:hypothetical protein ABKV19_008693 [Rosa sericea]